ncbi:Hypothetical protein PBC10988_7900 [Planctomycetales bacterium 10988]|nr:Hypothetical protein PBC10988_7900 [Planctomycetales bacterium 10988]
MFRSAIQTRPMAIGLTPKVSSNRTPAQRLGRWKLIQPLHRGPLTNVYQARCWYGKENQFPAAPKNYILKVLQPELIHTRGYRELFLKEIQLTDLLSQTKLPSFSEVVDKNTESASPWMVMEAAEGCEVKQYLEGDKLSSTELFKVWMKDALLALTAIHEQGWLHGDIKPSNLIVNETHATLIDLGSAQPLGCPPRSRGEGFSGTIHYLAPERLDFNLPCDHRSDYYSLGATMYEVLAGTPLFPGQDAFEIVNYHRFAQPTSLQKLCPELCPRLCELVHTLLEKEPQDRPSSTEEILQHLESV